ncbi:S41 family peptidase [uncultured Microscilla sp.]|uniref:S41 family peptidase n=1 Tax=uncultured Microscilla sp. TaxID=432653 RepID=UPI00261BD721|nr:S41 family peptidase [uncultured Microscilla sp.]
MVKPQKLFKLSLLVLLLSLSSRIQAQNNTRPQSLSSADKLYGLSLFWQEVNYNFAFFHQVPQLDWDKTYQDYIPKVLATKSTKEYYDVLKQFCALLQDGHTNVYYPPPIRRQLSYPKLKLVAIGKRAFVRNVDKSLAGKIPLGSEIVEVNKQPVEKYVQQYKLPYIASSTQYVRWDRGIRTMLQGKKNNWVQLKIKQPSGKILKVKLPRDRTGVQWVKPNKRPALLEFKWLDQQIAYLAINRFDDDRIQKEFPKFLSKLYQAKGVIIDVRKNGGGNSNNASFIVKHFTEQKILLGARWQTREHRAAYKAWGKFVNKKIQQKPGYQLNKWEANALKYYQKKAWYIGDTSRTVNDVTAKKIKVPLVVLTSYHTASAAEDFLIYLENIQRATRVGQKTYGSTGQPLMFDLPGGGKARVCTKNDTYPNGKEFIGYGIIPHVEVSPTVQNYVDNQDVALQKGVEVLKTKIKK